LGTLFKRLKALLECIIHSPGELAPKIGEPGIKSYERTFGFVGYRILCRFACEKPHITEFEQLF
jgi:hypothetical protein